MVNFFGERLKKLRMQKNITQEQLASHLDVNRMTIVKWEKGSSEPNISIVRYLAYFFDVGFDYLVGEDKFTLFLMIEAERFAKMKKNSSEYRNEQKEFAQWIVFWNDEIEACDGYNCDMTPFDEWEMIRKNMGWTEECNNLVLNYPDDYNKLIIDFIIKADYNGLLKTFYMLPTCIENDLPIDYDEKPALYKHLLGYEKP